MATQIYIFTADANDMADVLVTIGFSLRRATIVLLALANLLLAAQRARTKRPSETLSDRSIRFHTQMVQLGESCIFFGGTVTAGDFFLGLKRFDTPEGTHFRKGSNQIEYYPNRLSLVIGAAGRPCDVATPGPPYADLEVHLMRSLRFGAQWKRSMQMRAVNSIAFENGFVQGNKIWVYELTVTDKDVPLTDHLIVSIFAGDGQRLARLSAAP